MIDRARLERLNERVLSSDPTAPSDLFALVHRALTATVRKRIGASIPWEDAGNVATDAIAEYLREPGRFDPNRAGLFGYLLLIAHRDGLNLVRARRTYERHQDAVELSLPGGKDSGEDSITRLDADRILRDHLPDIVTEEGDDKVLRLFLDGERETSAYAEILGLSHLPDVQQKKLVKQRRDRIEQRLRRLKEVLK